MGRTFGVSLAWLNSELRVGKYQIGYINTKLMAADIFTKFYPKSKKETWNVVRNLIGIYHNPTAFRFLRVSF